MRSIGLLWLLGVCACSKPNKLFGLMTEDGGSSDSGSGATADPPPPSTSATTGEEPTAAADASTRADSGESDTTARPETDTASETQTSIDPDSGGMFVCDPMQNGFATNIPTDLATMEDWLGCDKQPPYQTLAGHGAMAGGALKFVEGSCNVQDENFTVMFGHSYPAVDHAFCGKLHVVWDPSPGCKIAAFTLEEYDPMSAPLGILYVLYHSPAPLPPLLPFEPALAPEGSCGCPDGQDGCCEFQPGQHALKVGEAVIEPGEIKKDIGDVLFTNWNAYIPATCIDDPDYAKRIDWFSAKK